MYRHDDEMDEYSESTTGLMLFLLGAAIGAGVALLFAPEQGTRTRERLREMASGAADQTRTAMGSAIDNVKGMAERGREYLQSKKEQLNTAYESGREAVGHEVGGNTGFGRTGA